MQKLNKFVVGVQSACEYKVSGQESMHGRVRQNKITVSFKRRSLLYTMINRRKYRMHIYFPYVMCAKFYPSSGLLKLTIQGKRDEIIKIKLTLAKPRRFLYLIPLLKRHSLPISIVKNQIFEERSFTAHRGDADNYFQLDTDTQSPARNFQFQIYKGDSSIQLGNKVLRLLRLNVSNLISKRYFFKKLEKVWSLGVLTDGASLIGAVCFEVKPQLDIGVLEYIAISSKYQKQGLGRALMASVEKYARGRGASKLGLEAISSKSQAFFIYQGYQPIRSYQKVKEFGWRPGKKRMFLEKEL